MEKGKLIEPSRIEGRGKAFPKILLMSVLFGVTSVFASVVCVWDNATGGYICSGEGTSVEVYGGSGQTLPPVVTNVVGVCTNCTDIAPDELRARLQTALDILQDSINSLQTAHFELMDAKSLVEDRQDVLSTYRHFTFPSRNINGLIFPITNYVMSAETEQAQIVKSNLDDTLPNVTGHAYSMYAWYGLESTYVLAQNEIANLTSVQDRLDETSLALDTASTRLNFEVKPAIRELINDCRECQYSTNGLSNGGTGGMGERWCTEEQGEAIINLLTELRDYGTQMQVYAQFTTNYLAKGVDLIREQFLTQFNGIPSDVNWRSVYFDQNPTAWGYDPTNIMHRLELLVFGLNGVTNMVALSSEDQARLDELDEREQDVTEEHQSNVDELQEGMHNQMANFRTDANGVPVQTLGSALVDLFRAIGGLDGRPLESGVEIFPSYPLRIGEQEYYIPQLNADESVDTVNQYQTLSRNVFSVIWYIMASVVIFLYWRWFAAYAHKFTKWASELAKAVMES